MNILFINEYHVNENEGGVQRVTKTLSEYLKKRSFNIYFISFKHGKKHSESEYEYCLCTSINCNYNEQFLKKIIDSKKIHCIINQYGFNKDIIKLVMSVCTSIPIITVLHSSPDYEIKDFDIQTPNIISLNNSFKLNIKTLLKPILRFLLHKKLSKRLKYIYSNSSQTILLSDNYKPIFEKLTKIRECSKLKCINNPIDPFFTLQDPLKLNKNKSVLFIGRLNKGKRIDLLLHIWKDLEAKNPDWKLDIVGDGPQFDYLQNLSHYLKLNNVIFHGNRRDVGIFYETSSIFVMTSGFEGFPMVIVEAQRYGTVPIIYNSFESITDIISNKKTGFIIPDLDKENFNKYLNSLMQDEKLRQIMSKNCVENSLKFNIDTIGEIWLKLLKCYAE